ncbi:MAG: DUF6138 family protein [Saezia sp.]
MQYYLECHDDQSGKFWQLTLEENKFTVTFGKLGTAGQSQQKEFSSADAARKEAEKLVASKRKKGYADASPPANSPAPKNPPVVKQAINQAAAKTPTPPPAGPAPLADDGTIKPWHIDYGGVDEDDDEQVHFTNLFMPERMRQALDEAKPDKKDLLIQKQAAAPGKSQNHLQALIAKYEREYYPESSFGAACIRGNYDDALFIYEHLIKPAAAGHGTGYLKEGAKHIIGTQRLDSEKLKLLRWIYKEGSFPPASIDDKYESKFPIMQDYMDKARETPNPDHETLEKWLLQKIDESYVCLIPKIASALRALANHVRTGAPFQEAKDLEDLLPDGCFPKGCYGLRLRFSSYSTLCIHPLGGGKPSDYCRVDMGMPELKGLSDFALPYFRKLLVPELQTLFKEGVFDGLFEDGCFIIDYESNEVLFEHINNPQTADTIEAQAKILETGENWEENAKLLPRVVVMLINGTFLPADPGRALQIVLRHMYCPNRGTSKIAEDILEDEDERPEWAYEVAVWKYLSVINYESAIKTAKTLIHDFNYQPAEELLKKIEKNVQRAKQLESRAGVIISDGEQIDRRKGPFESFFTEEDLFFENENVIIRAYKDGTIVIRFLIEGEAAYAETLDFVNALLVKGYALKVKNWTSTGGFTLRVRFLHKPVVIEQIAKTKPSDIEYPITDTHHFFARAVQYPALREKVKRYANLALQKFHWYTDLDCEDNTVTGTFAAAALAFCGLEYMPTVCKYGLAIDDEHSYIHLTLPGALFDHYGVQPELMPAMFELCAANGQGGEIKMPKDILASGKAARALLDYLQALGLQLEGDYESMLYIMPMMMYSDAAKNLKKLREYHSAASSAEDKNSLAVLYNLYLRTLQEHEGESQRIKPLPMVESTDREEEALLADQEIEKFVEPVLAVIHKKEAATYGIDMEKIVKRDGSVGFFFSPAVHPSLELLDFSRRQWEMVGDENRKGSSKRCYMMLCSGPFDLLLGDWVVMSNHFAASYGLILFDGKNKPVVLYGVLDSIPALIDFNQKKLKTAQDLEQLRLKHLRFSSPLKEHSEAASRLEQLLDETAANFLRGDFAIAELYLLRIASTDKPAYAAARVMLAYLAQRRGEAENMAKFCEELALLKPDEKAYWLGKKALAESLA